MSARRTPRARTARTNTLSARAPLPDPAIVRAIDQTLGRRTCAVVHEWVAQRAGSELVFERLAQLLPESSLVTLSWEPSVILDVSQPEVQVSVLDASALRDRRSITLVAMPWIWRRLGRRRPYDVVVSSSHAFARCFAETASPAIHLSYVHTPARYLWFSEADARAARAPAPLVNRLRAIDWASAQEPHLAANSAATGARIEQAYGRASTIVPPPVNVSYFGAEPPLPRSERTHLLSVGRWIAYKRHDVAIEAAVRLGMPIIVAGAGPLAPRLRAMARTSDLVRLVNHPTDAQLRTLYRQAIALVYPAHEDFGIVPVEAQAAGTPVVALDVGGTRESVVDGATGVHVGEQHTDAFAAGVTRILGEGIDPWRCQRHAQAYSYGAFDERIAAWITGATA